MAPDGWGPEIAGPVGAAATARADWSPSAFDVHQ